MLSTKGNVWGGTVGEPPLLGAVGMTRNTVEEAEEEPSAGIGFYE